MGVGMRGPKIVWDAPPLDRYRFYHTKFGHSLSNGTAVITEICRKKIDPSCPAFQGQSRSLEPTGIDRITSY